jgi:SCY1-like protein 2
LATLDFSTIKNEVFPVIATVFSKTSSLGIKIRGLEALKVLCGGNTDAPSHDDDDFSGIGNDSKKPKINSVILDKYSIQERVVPLLKAIKTKEPAVMMAALDVFREIGKIADSDFLAVEVLPILWNFSLGPLLDLQQFQAFMALIRFVSTRIEQDQTRKLQELSSSTQTAASRNDLMSFGGLPGSSMNGVDDSNGDTFSFEQLVLGRGGNTGNSFSSPTDSLDAWGSRAKVASQSERSSIVISSNTPTFSWSTVQDTPSSTLSTRPANQSSSTSGAMGGFGVLQPISASSSTSGFAALQPSKPVSPGSLTNPMSKAVNWSTTTSPSSANPWAATSSATNTASNLWASANTTTSTNTWASSSTPNYNINVNNALRPSPNPASSFAISPPPMSSNSSSYSGFGIAPPPQSKPLSGTLGTLGNMQNFQPQKQQKPTTNGQKSGLDKYESLI